MNPTPTDPREAVTADFCAQTNQELSREDLHKLMEQLQSTNSKLAAEIAELKRHVKDVFTINEGLLKERATLRAELEAARKERESDDKTILRLIEERNTALAAKDAAEKRVKLLEEAGKTGYEALRFVKRIIETGQDAPDSNLSIEVAVTDSIYAIDSILTPAPTQEPPAGGLPTEGSGAL